MNGNKLPSCLASVTEEEIVSINGEDSYIAFQVLWYILKQLFTLVTVNVVDIYHLCEHLCESVIINIDQYP